MTENRRNDTGQVSVAELLARNGQKVNSRVVDAVGVARAAESPSPS